MAVWGKLAKKAKTINHDLPEDDLLELQQDIYSFTFFKFIYCKNPVVLADLMML